MNVEHDIIHQGPLFDIDRLNWADSQGQRHTREVIRHPGAVVILPVLEQGQIVMIRNQRPAVQEQLWELPAGTRELDEDPEHTAVRELTEETGYIASQIEFLGHIYTTPGFCDEQLMIYVASKLKFGEQQLDPGESIEVHSLTEDEIIALIASGDLVDSKTLAALHLWQIRGFPGKPS